MDQVIHKEKPYPFLQGGGEMGELTRNFNWAATPVGDPSQWPQSLRTTVSNLLHSRFPMFLWWGEEMIQFYNDAYRPSLGKDGKHPSALGARGIDTWPEIWHIISPLHEQVRTSGEATWKEDQLVPIYRNGKIEDVYWTYSYSSVLDDEGKHGGILVTCVETTDKVNYLKQLAESEDLLRFAIESTELGTWDYNPVTNQFIGNARLKEWFGLPPEVSIDLTLALTIVVERDRSRVEMAIQRALQFESGGFYEIEYSIYNHKQARERTVRAKGRAWFNEEKIAYRFNGTLQDITEEVTAHRKITEAEERARLSIEAAELGTYEVNLLTREILASQRFKEIIGVNDASGHQDYVNAIHPDDLEIRSAAYKKAFQTGMLEYDGRVNWKDGSLHWVRVKGKMYFDENQQPVKLLGVIQDITEENAFWQELEKQVKSRTEELVKVQESLLNANAYFQTIINLCKEPVQVLEPVYSEKEIIDFRFRLTNIAYASYAKTTPEHLKGKLVSEFFPGYFQTSSFTDVVEVFQSGIANSWEIHYNVDGLDLYNQMSATRIGDEVVVYFTDFTRLKQLQLELIRKIEELERSNKNLEDFAYAASHDLKEPIRKVHFFSDRLRNSLYENLSEDNRRYFERMETASKRMSSLIDDLISYSQVSLYPRVFEEVNMNELIDLVLNDLDVEIEESGAIIEVGELCTIEGYHRQLQQVFHNLVVNALKYRKPDLKSHIRISCKKLNGNEIDLHLLAGENNRQFYAITIEDNGIGFDQKDAERIFNVFTRLHGNAEYRGSGIGLSIVRKVMENHHGYITADGELGEGARFTVYLPEGSR